MLIRFAVQNWMSYRDQATLSMVASRERQHGQRVARPRKNLGVLPIAAIYGGNASGKSNLFKALNFAKQFIVQGTQVDQVIAVQPFRLDAQTQQSPSEFVFEVLVGDTIYDYRFVVTHQQVVMERLSLVRPTTEQVIFERHQQTVEAVHAPHNEQSFWKFIKQAMRPNQLLLTTAIQLQHAPFLPLYHWFRDTLLLIAPDARFGDFERFVDKQHRHFDQMNHFLRVLDTGIYELSGQEVPLSLLPLPDEIKIKLQSDIPEGVTARIVDWMGSERIIVTRRNGELAAQKIVAMHERSDGGYEAFGMEQESDGTNRIIDLLPAILEAADQLTPHVVVIDEIDRSLHTMVSHQLVQHFLGSCTQDTRSQLLLTVHDVLLMDQDIFRRDEMWVTERRNYGASTLTALCEYSDVRYDKDIRKSYLQGRFGGIPRVFW
jgi:AAA15 family ATPase/GTPase